MRTMKPLSPAAEPGPDAPDIQDAEAPTEDGGAEAGTEVLHGESYDIFRVTCPDCGQPIALLADEETLPEHALCPVRWNPFGLTVCRGSGRFVADTAASEDGSAEPREQDAATLLTLPESLDWRTQPFSHLGGPGTRPMRLARTARLY